MTTAWGGDEEKTNPQKTCRRHRDDVTWVTRNHWKTSKELRKR